MQSPRAPTQPRSRAARPCTHTSAREHVPPDPVPLRRGGRRVRAQEMDLSLDDVRREPRVRVPVSSWSRRGRLKAHSRPVSSRPGPPAGPGSRFTAVSPRRSRLVDARHKKPPNAHPVRPAPACRGPDFGGGRACLDCSTGHASRFMLHFYSFLGPYIIVQLRHVPRFILHLAPVAALTLAAAKPAPPRPRPGRRHRAPCMTRPHRPPHPSPTGVAALPPGPWRGLEVRQGRLDLEREAHDSDPVGQTCLCSSWEHRSEE